MKIKAVNPRTKRSQVTTKAQRDVYVLRGGNIKMNDFFINELMT